MSDNLNCNLNKPVDSEQEDTGLFSNKYNIIFLDIDGVLNNHYTFISNHRCQLDTASVKLFVKVLTQIPNVKVVISSSWRYPGSIESFLAYIHEYKETDYFEGIIKYLHKDYCTERLSGKIRGKEIKLWLDNHSYEVNKYLCIDDDSDYMKDQPLLLTNREIGFGLSEYNFVRLYFDIGSTDEKVRDLFMINNDIEYSKRIFKFRRKLIDKYLG